MQGTDTIVDSFYIFGADCDQTLSEMAEKWSTYLRCQKKETMDELVTKFEAQFKEAAVLS